MATTVIGDTDHDLLLTLHTKFDAFMKRNEAVMIDHEARLRALEAIESKLDAFMSESRTRQSDHEIRLRGVEDTEKQFIGGMKTLKLLIGVFGTLLCGLGALLIAHLFNL